jgi:hypothetical protein
VSAARVRYALRTSKITALDELAARSLACESADAVSTLINEALRHTFPELRNSNITV